jgi:hypothetical protein
LRRFLALIHNNHTYFKALSLRRGNDFHYCTFLPNIREGELDDRTSRPAYSSVDRYEAVNVTNANTIEVRFPASTTTHKWFLAQLEMVLSLVEYTKRNANTLSLVGWVAYVLTHKRTNPNLIKLLKRLGFTYA